MPCKGGLIYHTCVKFVNKKIKMTSSIEIALISDDNDQLNTAAVWDIHNGTQLMQYRGETLRN
jgi:hypothetical protein